MANYCSNAAAHDAILDSRRCLYVTTGAKFSRPCDSSRARRPFSVPYGNYTYAVSLPRNKFRNVRSDISIQIVETGKRDALPRQDIRACISGLNRMIPGALRVDSIC